MPLVRGILDGRHEIGAAAQLLHGLGFNRVRLDTPKLSYEPRWSCQCKEKSCTGMWVASKSGDVMRIRLHTEDGQPEQAWFVGDREARTLYHQHDGEALGGGTFLLIGRDDGALDIVPDDHEGWQPVRPMARSHDGIRGFYLEAWASGPDRHAWIPVADGYRSRAAEASRGIDTRSRYTHGITAISVLPRPGSPRVVDLLVATRYPRLYVLEAAAGRLRLRRHLHMPGWIEWIIGPSLQDPRVTLISRGGDILRISHADLLGEGTGDHQVLSVLPTAAMPFGDGGLLLGTTTGLTLVRDDHSEDAITVPVTRSPVLCLDRERAGHDDQHYVVMGLDSGQLRVAHAASVLALASGRRSDEQPEVGRHNFAVDLGSAVLAVETLRPHDELFELGELRDTVYVLAVLRDHSVCLFEVASRPAQRTMAATLWRGHVLAGTVDGGAPGRSPRLSEELAAASAPPPAGCPRDAWRYLLIDTVLERLAGDTPERGDSQRQIVELACHMTGGADRSVLHRLSVALGPLSRGDVGIVLRISRAILRAIPRGDDAVWLPLVTAHLHELNRLARSAEERGRARLVAWTRFVRKYLLRGKMFSEKRIGLLELVTQNHETTNYFDALIYQARLWHRRYDLRWEFQVAEEVAALHSVAYQGWPPIAVVVTVHGRLVCLDHETGQRLTIERGGRQLEALTPWEGMPGHARSRLDERGQPRTLASAIVADGATVRIALSCHGGPVRAPGVMVVDLRRRRAHGPAAASLVVESIACSVECADGDAWVHALHPVPGRGDVFVTGMASDTWPVGQLQRSGDRWALELARDATSTEGHPGEGAGLPSELESLAPGKVPTRALTVAAVRDVGDIAESAPRYLAVAGSDDGLVRAFSFSRGEGPASWHVRRWDRLADAIVSVALGSQARPPGPVDPDSSLFTCYLGTVAGDTFALSIHKWNDMEPASNGVPFGGYDAQPLWRESHDGPVLAVHLWRTPLYPSGRGGAGVLVAVTEKGRLCVYNHNYSYADRERISATLNYHFHGMRFDRIATPDRLRALALFDGEDEFVAAGPGGHLYMAKLVGLRDSDQWTDADAMFGGGEARAAGPGERLAVRARPVGSSEREDRLSTRVWTRMRQLFEATTHDVPFELVGAEREDLKRDLCDLVRLQGGALSTYALYERLSRPDAWPADPDELRRKAEALLYPLRPDDPGDAELIKVIVKSLCREFLFRRPDELKRALRIDPTAELARHAQTMEVCALVADYITGRLAYPSQAAARLRIVAIKELLRVPLLCHLVPGAPGRDTICAAVTAAFESCLQDDNRLVRFEALRAVSVMLRNVSIMLDDADAASLVQGLLPCGLDSVDWLLEVLVRGLKQFPSFTRRTAMVSGAWYLITAVLQLFRIFRDRTLVLCEYLIRRGLSIEVIAMCFRSLRRQRMFAIRRRIANLYLLLPALDQPDVRTAYLERYHGPRARELLLEEMDLDPPRPTAHARSARREWYEIGDAEMADHLIRLLDHLARMWSAATREQVRGEASRVRPSVADRDLLPNDLQRVVQELAAFAESQPSGGVDDTRALLHLAALDERMAALTPPLRQVASGIVATWRGIYSTAPAEPGMSIGESGDYVLGERLSSGGAVEVFALDRHPPDLEGELVIKVLQRLDAPDAVARFLDAAHLNQELCEARPDGRYIVEVYWIWPGPRYPAYVMRRHGRPLEDYLTPGVSGFLDTTEDGRLLWIGLVAHHIGCALRAVHDQHWHGEVTAAKILVEYDGAAPTFRLGDFDQVDAADRGGAAGVVPGYLSQKGLARGPAGRRQWDDIVALSLILYRMLTGRKLDLHLPDRIAEHLDGLRVLARQPAILRHSGAHKIVGMLRRVFDHLQPAFDIHEFLVKVTSAGVAPSRRSPSRSALDTAASDAESTDDARYVRRPKSVLFLSASPADLPFLQLTREIQQIRDQLFHTERREVFLIDPRWEVNVDQVPWLVGVRRPDIVHFGGHGTHAGRLVFEDAGGESAPHRFGGIANMFRWAGSSVRLVVVSACHSCALACALSEHIDAAIGMCGEISDDHALRFSKLFYQMIGIGRDVNAAFQIAYNALANLPDERPAIARDVMADAPACGLTALQGLPRLFVRDGVNASRLRFVRPPRR